MQPGGKGQAPPDFEEVASQAQDSALPAGKRVELLLRAAIGAEIAANPARALELATRALEVAGDDHALRSQALTELGVQAKNRGEQDLSRNLLLEAIKHAEVCGEKRLLARARSNLAITLRKLALPDLALDESNIAARLFRDLGDLAGVNRTLHLRAQILQDQGLLADARTTLEEVIELDQMTGDLRGRARSLGNLGLLLAQMDRPQDALVRLEEAMRAFELVGSRIDVMRARNNIAMLRRNLGQMQQAVDCLRQSAEESLALGLVHERSQALADLASILAEDAQWDEAERVVNEAGEGPDFRRRHLNAMTRARIAMARRLPHEALEWVDMAAAIARDAASPPNLACALRVRAQVLHGILMHDDAREAVLEALEQLDQRDPAEMREQLVCTVLAARIERARGEHGAAQALAREAAEHAPRWKGSPERDVRRALADLHELQGQM